jgi:hypothetical protein
MPSLSGRWLRRTSIALGATLLGASLGGIARMDGTLSSAVVASVPAPVWAQGIRPVLDDG